VVSWRLVFTAQAGREAKKLAERHPDRVREMTAMYDAWAGKCGVIPWNQLQAEGKKNR
jgi:arylsulfatase